MPAAGRRTSVDVAPEVRPDLGGGGGPMDLGGAPPLRVLLDPDPPRPRVDIGMPGQVGGDLGEEPLGVGPAVSHTGRSRPSGSLRAEDATSEGQPATLGWSSTTEPPLKLSESPDRRPVGMATPGVEGGRHLGHALDRHPRWSAARCTVTTSGVPNSGRSVAPRSGIAEVRQVEQHPKRRRAAPRFRGSVSYKAVSSSLPWARRRLSSLISGTGGISTVWISTAGVMSGCRPKPT